MQYEGDAKDYNEGYFSTTRTLIVDTVAPQSNIGKLVELAGVYYDSVRSYGNGYNTSVNSGIYRYCL